MPSGHAKVSEVEAMVGAEPLAKHIANEWHRLKQARAPWEADRLEQRNFVYATDTTTTTNSTLEWSNTTTVPKLCAMRDLLHAHYMAALFPGDDFLIWQPDKPTPKLREITKSIRAYMTTKFTDSGFKLTVSQLIYDWIDYGNCFGDVEYVRTADYSGPQLRRIDPLSIVFDLSASSFAQTPKIVRDVYTMGDLVKKALSEPENTKFLEVIEKAKGTREGYMAMYGEDDVDYHSSLIADGFGSLIDYYRSGYVEVLQFQGDIYAEGKLMVNRRIYVIDRAYVLVDEEIPSWYGSSTITHNGWRMRPGNIMSMGPLDNVVGMQYRMDHLQNAKSDIYDLHAFPPLKIKGYVEDFEYAPMERIYVGDEGDVTPVPPDSSVLNTNLDIDWIEAKMEEMVGAPKQLAGEAHSSRQTAFEVRTLDDNAATLFTDKLLQFETEFIERVANLMLATARNNLDTDDIARSTNRELGIQEFLTITPELINTSGKIKPIAARHYAERQQRIQNLNGFMNSSMGQDPGIRQHWSNKKLSRLVEEWLGFKDFEVYGEYAGLEESVEAQQYASELQEQAVQEEEDALDAKELELDGDTPDVTTPPV